MRVRTMLVFLIVAAGTTTLAQIEAPRQLPPTTAPTAAPRPAQAPAAVPRTPFSRDRYRIAHEQFTLDNGLAPDRPRRSLGAGRRREPLVPRRLAQRAAWQDRLRAPVRALLLQRQRAPSGRVPRGHGRPRRQQPQRHDQLRPDELLRERAGAGARTRRSSSRPIGWGSSPRGSPRRASSANAAWSRTRSARARTSLYAKAFARVSETLYPGRAPLQLVDHRQHGRPRRRVARRRQGVVSHLLRPGQLRAVAGRRHHATARAASS